jgi:Ser/Thr protein kinase RdoA (MazF antagonist)
MANDPFTALQTPAPDFSMQQASALLRENYGIDASLEPLGSERDQNFLAAATDGSKYVLKIANASESVAVTDFQNQALLHIARVAPEIPVPRVIPANDGKLMFEVESVAGDTHRVRLLSWLEGIPLQHAQGVRAVARQMGECLAQIGLALRDFEHTAGDYALLWDIRNAASLEKLLPYVDDRDLRKLCAQRLSRFRDVIAPQLDTLRSQVIHNDMNPSNVLVDAADVNRVTGVIDFGDMVFSRLVNDVAVAAAYFCRIEDDPFAEVAVFLDAYTDVLPLTEDEIALLPDLILTRHLTTVMITHWRASLYPDNAEYILRSEGRARILRSEGRARRMLYLVVESSIKDTASRFLGVCRRVPGKGARA